jgi:hypothetical protein
MAFLSDGPVAISNLIVYPMFILLFLLGPYFAGLFYKKYSAKRFQAQSKLKTVGLISLMFVLNLVVLRFGLCVGGCS